jgi:hypothetical protein
MLKLKKKKKSEMLIATLKHGLIIIKNLFFDHAIPFLFN